MVCFGLQFGHDNHRWVQANVDRLGKDRLILNTGRLCRQAHKDI